MGLLKKVIKRKIKGLKSSAKGDFNSLFKNALRSGKGSNMFDRRASDGLEDLIHGLIGVRTSDVPEISGEVQAAKNAARLARHKALNASNARPGDHPGTKVTLQFPKSYFDEKGGGVGHIAAVDESSATWNGGIGMSGQEIQRNKRERLLAQQTAFPNSIHFRSLPRKKQDHSEGLVEGTGPAGSKGAQYISKGGDAGGHGSVDPASETLYDIFLYLPQQLADSVKVAYTEGEAGIMESLFARLFTGGDSNVKEKVGGQNLDMAEVLKSLRSSLPGGKIIQSAMGNMVNPMKFQTLENVEFRNYSYKFTLKPTTAAEALEIREIIAAFKHSSLPGTAGENQRIWTFPNEWAIKFQGPIKNWVDFPLVSVCTGVDIDYGGGGPIALMEDGAPASIDLTVEFRETTQISRQKFAEQVSAQNWATRDTGYADKGTRINQSALAGAQHSASLAKD